MNKGLIALGAVVAAVPVLVVGGAVLALADEEEEQTTAPAGGLNTSLLPEHAQQYVPWIRKSARQCADLSSGLLAAQIKQESNFRADAKGPPTQYGRAIGISQFLPSTFATYGEDSDGDGETGPQDPQDSIMAQGKYMCSLIARGKKSGYGADPVKLALAGYNAGWGNVQKYSGVPPFKETTHYVATITANAARFTAAVSVDGSGAAAAAVRRAATQLGTPYSWGGGKPSGPTVGFCDGTNGYAGGECSASKTAGFDCSSLVQYAYWPSQKLPRTAGDQYSATAGKKVAKSDLKTGDLLFWQNSGGIYHVAIYYKEGKVLHAPRTGKPVQVQAVDQAMPAGDYLGATRPG